MHLNFSTLWRPISHAFNAGNLSVMQSFPALVQRTRPLATAIFPTVPLQVPSSMLRLRHRVFLTPTKTFFERGNPYFPRLATTRYFSQTRNVSYSDTISGKKNDENIFTEDKKTSRRFADEKIKMIEDQFENRIKQLFDTISDPETQILGNAVIFCDDCEEKSEYLKLIDQYYQLGIEFEESLEYISALGKPKVIERYIHNRSLIDIDYENYIEKIVNTTKNKYENKDPSSFHLMANLLGRRCFLDKSFVDIFFPFGDLQESLKILQSLADKDVEEAVNVLSDAYYFNSLGMYPCIENLNLSMDERLKGLYRLALSGNLKSQKRLVRWLYEDKLNNILSGRAKTDYFYEMLTLQTGNFREIALCFAANGGDEWNLELSLEKRISILTNRAKNNDVYSHEILIKAFISNGFHTGNGFEPFPFSQQENMKKLEKLRLIDPIFWNKIVKNIHVLPYGIDTTILEMLKEKYKLRLEKCIQEENMINSLKIREIVESDLLQNRKFEKIKKLALCGDAFARWVIFKTLIPGLNINNVPRIMGIRFTPKLGKCITDMIWLENSKFIFDIIDAFYPEDRAQMIKRLIAMKLTLKSNNDDYLV